MEGRGDDNGRDTLPIYRRFGRQGRGVLYGFVKKYRSTSVLKRMGLNFKIYFAGLLTYMIWTAISCLTPNGDECLKRCIVLFLVHVAMFLIYMGIYL